MYELSVSAPVGSSVTRPVTGSQSATKNGSAFANTSAVTSKFVPTGSVSSPTPGPPKSGLVSTTTSSEYSESSGRSATLSKITVV